MSCNSESNANIDDDIQRSEDDITGMVDKDSMVLSYGLYDDKEIIIDTYIDAKYDDEYNLTFEMGQYYPNDLEFKLLVFEDYIQKDFYTDEETVSSVDYTVKSNGIEKIDFKIYPDQQANEVSILNIISPNIQLQDIDEEFGYDSNTAYPIRRAVSQEVNKKEFDQNVEVNNIDEVNFDSFLSRSEGEFELINDADKGESLYLNLGNIYDRDVTYAVIALLDWKQVPLNGKDVLFTKVDKDKTGVLEIELPDDIDGNPSYQLIAFSYPYEIEEGNYDAADVYPTQRIFLK
ncbi:hypothetical protein DH09_11475 [Bacillaceae bacterium JMAK1]|nr:hypothetical protein DH09_11475 [Bacillaceae bacterium JMAK1]